jgi:iron complex outermembrane receptor protein
MAMRQVGISLVVLLLLAPFVRGGTIAGRVTARGEPQAEALVGATVLVKGTVRGTTTSVHGEFRIPDVPFGTYTLVVSMVGYQRETVSNVVVEEGKETVLAVLLSPATVQMDQVVVTASRRQQSLQEVPVSLSVLDASQIEQRNSLSIEEALRYIPGVNLTGFQVNIRGSSGYSRGAGSRVLMLLDGIPFITGDTGELNFESIPIGQVDRIEVVKGASSALYGSSALGGVINVITKDIPDRPVTHVRLYGGAYNKPSYEQWEWTESPRWLNGQSIGHSYRSGRLGMSLYFSRQMDEGYRQNDYRRRHNFYVKAVQDLTTASSLTVNAGLLDQYGGQFLYWRNLDSALVPPILQATDNIRSTRYFLSGSYRSVASEGVLFTGKAMWYHNLWGFETLHGYGRAESQADDFRAEVLSTIVVDDVHTVTAGAEANVDVVGGDIFENRTVGGAAAYAQDEISVTEHLSLTAGVRFDFQSVGLTSPGGQFNPKIAAAYTPFPTTTIRASFGRGFRVPSVAEAFIEATASNLTTIPNADLKPEQSLSYEVGVAQQFGDFATIDVAAFRSDYDNLIEAGLILSGQNLLIQWRNVTRARVQGVEASLKLGLFEGAIQSGVNYTYVFPEDRSIGDVLKYRPRHLVYADLRARVGWLSAGADFRFVSRVDRIDQELVDVGIVADGIERTRIIVTDVRLGVDFPLFGADATATAMVNNVFQYNYVELIGNMMPPRTYMLVLELRP